MQDLLGDVRSFKVNFERCITAGNDKHAGTREREQAASKAAALRSIIAPYFLRREKKEVLQGIDRWVQMVRVLVPSGLHRGCTGQALMQHMTGPVDNAESLPNLISVERGRVLTGF